MKKIANANELQEALGQIMEYAASPNPSREVLAAQLSGLSDRVAGVTGVDMGSLKAAWKSGKDSKDSEQDSDGLMRDLEHKFTSLQDSIKELSRAAGRSNPIAPLGMPTGIFSDIGNELWYITFLMGSLSP